MSRVKIGSRVRILPLQSLFDGLTGIVFDTDKSLGWWVRLNVMVRRNNRTSTDWIFWDDRLEVIDLTPEEELKWQAQEQDQQRRQQHADKYL